MAEYRKGDTASWDSQEVRRAQGEAPRKNTRRRRKRRMNPILYLLLVILASALLAGVGWLLMSDLCEKNHHNDFIYAGYVCADSRLL